MRVVIRHGNMYLALVRRNNQGIHWEYLPDAAVAAKFDTAEEAIKAATEHDPQVDVDKLLLVYVSDKSSRAINAPATPTELHESIMTFGQGRKPKCNYCGCTIGSNRSCKVCQTK